jgi:aldehyde:ferredoxin oxidoreductase
MREARSAGRVADDHVVSVYHVAADVAVHQCSCSYCPIRCARTGTLPDGRRLTLRNAISGYHPHRAG